MARLEELFAWRESVLSRILSDSLLCKAISNPDSETALTGEVEFPEDLLYKNIFPYKKNFDNIVETKESFLTMDFSFSAVEGAYFKNAAMIFYVIIHEDLSVIQLQNGKRVLRSDFIATRLDTLFNQRKDTGVGIGKLSFRALKSVDGLPSSFIGTAIIYSTVEFT